MSTDQPHPEHGSNDRDRLTQIEESMGYLELDGSRAREQFDVLSKAIHELGGRMERLESRMLDLNHRIETADPGVVAPPHSAGPDITRDPL